MAKSFAEALKQRAKGAEKVLKGDVKGGSEEIKDSQKTFRKMNKKKDKKEK